jgi:hypothetical protein
MKFAALAMPPWGNLFLTDDALSGGKGRLLGNNRAVPSATRPRVVALGNALVLRAANEIISKVPVRRRRTEAVFVGFLGAKNS